MGKDRLAAFSDGMFAIIITIMVLELHAPHGDKLVDLMPVLPALLSYTLSFIYVAIYWNNHHHMIHTVQRVNGAILWANIHLLFWLSLVPFTTAWLGAHHFATVPTAVYGFVLLMPAISYYVLQLTIIRAQGVNSLLGRAVGRDVKGKLSVALYLSSILLAFVHPVLSNLIFVFVALMWLVPDRRIEKKINDMG
jgi:uncharacterized membrane protein